MQAIGNFESNVNEKLDNLDKRIGRIEEYLEQFSRFNEEV